MFNAVEINIASIPLADTIGGDEQMLVIEESQIKRKQINQSGIVMATTDAVTGNQVFGDTELPVIISRSNVPVVVGPGTVATNGIITFSTALPTTYNTPGCWIHLPADAVVGGLAGFYWAVMTSTTQGQVYTLYLPAGTTTVDFEPYYPTETLTNAVGSNSAYTQSTSLIRLMSATLPADTMGPNGILRYEAIYSGNTGAAGARTLGWGLGPNYSQTSVLLQTTYAGAHLNMQLRNRGVTNRQLAKHNALQENAGSTSALVYFTENTATDLKVWLPATLANAADVIVMEGYDIVVNPKN